MKQAWLLFPVIVALAAGCASPESRSKERQGSFDKLSARQKADVLEGKVAVGMTTDAVYIAFGEPSRISKNGGVEKWIYTKPEFYDVPHWQYRCIQRGDGHVATIPEYDPLQMKREVDSLEVIFKKGRVTDWRKL